MTRKEFLLVAASGMLVGAWGDGPIQRAAGERSLTSARFSNVKKEDLQTMNALLARPVGEVRAVLEKAESHLKSRLKVTGDPYPRYDPRVMAVLKSLKSDSDYLTRYEAIKDKAITTYTLAEIATFYTFLVRGERFSDGHIAAYIEDGTLYRLVKRQQELLVEVPLR